MANKSLTDLTARTATADSDLIHVNSGRTDYQQTKADFCKGIVTKITFNNTSTLTSQCEALANQNYTGYISSAGHVTETGVPEDTYYWVFVYKQGSNNIRIEIKELASAGRSYHNTKTTQGWSGWMLDPTRNEITSLNNSLPKSYDTGILSDITIAPNREASIDKPSALIGKEIISINILSWSSASGVFFIAGMYDASPRFFIGGDPGTVIKGLNLRIWYKG